MASEQQRIDTTTKKAAKNRLDAMLGDRLFWLSALLVGVLVAATFVVMFNRNINVSDVPRILIPTGVLAALVSLGPHENPLTFIIAWIAFTAVLWTLIAFVIFRWVRARINRRD